MLFLYGTKLVQTVTVGIRTHCIGTVRRLLLINTEALALANDRPMVHDILIAECGCFVYLNICWIWRSTFRIDKLRQSVRSWFIKLWFTMFCSHISARGSSIYLYIVCWLNDIKGKGGVKTTIYNRLWIYVYTWTNMIAKLIEQENKNE